jgi:hypothetical protein
MELSSGQMELNMKASGIIIKQRERGHSGTLKVMYTMGNLKMIKLTAMGYTLTSMDLDMRAFGKMICKKGMAARSGVMVLNIQGLTRKERNITMECTSGLMPLGTKETGMRTK